MQRGVPQDVVLKGKYRKVTLADTFRFECKRCGACCFRCEIVLTPYDLLRLCQYLQMSTFRFIERYAFVAIGPNSGLPVVALDFEKVQARRGGGAAIAPCPFLAFDGVTYSCGVYPARPGCCRSYPLFRVAVGETITEPRFALQEVTCAAGQTNQEYTVAQWIEHEGLAEYHEANQAFLSQVMRLTVARGKEGEWPRWFQAGLATLWYDFSGIREGEALQEKYALAMQLAEKAVDRAIQELPHLLERGQCG